MNGLSYRYCTGGIRCEMASAYIRSLGDGFDNVFQVSSCIKFEFLRFPCEQKMGYPFLSVEEFCGKLKDTTCFFFHFHSDPIAEELTTCAFSI